MSDEVIEAAEAAEAPDAWKITQYANCKLSFPVKRPEQAKTVSLHLVHSNSFLHNFFAPFLLEAVENRNVTFSPIPTKLCHVIYCDGDKSYPCLIGIGLT